MGQNPRLIYTFTILIYNIPILVFIIKYWEKSVIYDIDSMTSNERVILSLLSQHKHLSRTKIAKYGSMSWATAVKMVNRLVEKELVVYDGRADNPTKPGKKDVLYALNEVNPVVIGIDIEYSLTRIVLVNLYDTILVEQEIPTPQKPSVHTLQLFLKNIIEQFITQHVLELYKLAGIGIGLPGVVIPSWIKPDLHDNRTHLEHFLETTFNVKVKAEINVRAYTNYEKWHNKHVFQKDFILVSVRSGLGMGIIFNNSLFVSHRSISGELGHIKVNDQSDILCRCGKYGCLETMVNQHSLFQDFMKISPEEAAEPTYSDPRAIDAKVAELFSSAKNGDLHSLEVLEKAAHYLGKALSASLMMFYVPNIMICGHFGEDGDIFLPMVERVLKDNLLPQMSVNLMYEPIDGDRYAHGAALLILEQFLDYETVGQLLLQ